LKSIHKRFAAVLSVLMLAAGVSAVGPATAGAATDVMIVFDTTGSMGKALTEAKMEIQEAMAQLSASLPDVRFGLAEVSDYDEVNNAGPFSYGIGEGFAPWTLHTGITPNQDQVTSALLKLEADGGGDGPEAYGRALYETDVNPAVGWRPGARGVIIVVLDNLPHDNDVNEGIPEEAKIGTTYDTGVDPGRDNTVGTADDLDFQSTVLQQLKSDGRPIGVVDYVGGVSGYLPYWEYWAGLTGGSTLDGETGFLGKEIVELTKKAAAAAPLSDCPAGQVHDASENCVDAPSPPPPPASNNFKYEPRISCSRGCRVVIVKITFDSDGNVIGESIPEEEKGTVFASFSAAKQHKQGKGRKKNACARKKKHAKRHSKAKGKAKSSARRHKKGKGKAKAKCKRPPLIRKFSQAVSAGTNALKLKLTRAGIKQLNRKGKLNVGVKLTYTPNGGEAKVLTHTYKLVKPKNKHGKGKKKGQRGKRKSKR